MATIAEQLTELQAVKSGLKTALASDGTDMSAVSFPEYPGKVQAMSERWRSLLDGSITEVDFTGYTEIRTGICMHCDSLNSIVIPDNCVKIGSRAFWSCKKLGDTVVPNSVSIIESIAFSGCTAMKKLVIGSGCSRIELQALRIGSSSNPATIIMRPTIPPQIDSTTIGEYVAKIIVPYASVTEYPAATNWAAQAGKFEARLALRYEDGMMVIDHDILDGDVSAYLYRAEMSGVSTDAGYKVYYYANDVTPGQEYVDPITGGSIVFESNPDRPPTEVWYYNGAWYYSNPDTECFYEYGGVCPDCGVTVHSDRSTYPACPVCGYVFWP